MKDEDIIGKTKRYPADFFEGDSEEAYPSRFYIKDAFGDLLFFLVRDRVKAQEILTHLYGKKYKLRETHQTKQNKPKTAAGTNSAKGFQYRHKK
jgi:hypothetical protein